MDFLPFVIYFCKRILFHFLMDGERATDGITTQTRTASLSQEIPAISQV